MNFCRSFFCCSVRSLGKVGINTTNPLSTLDVLGDGGIYIRTVTNQGNAKIRFYRENIEYGRLNTKKEKNDCFIFKTKGNPKSWEIEIKGERSLDWFQEYAPKMHKIADYVS